MIGIRRPGAVDALLDETKPGELPNFLAYREAVARDAERDFHARARRRVVLILLPFVVAGFAWLALTMRTWP